MPKMKSNRSAKKRFKLTGGGRIRRYKAGKSHLLSKKTSKRKRSLRRATLVHPTEERKVRKLILA
ncbi:MAG: 50S ribosomal protein L35 [candidate division KSB1 bacterium]|nr:50S ribosomal protein L35 [candidate division KSB1 bacterium]